MKWYMDNSLYSRVGLEHSYNECSALCSLQVSFTRVLASMRITLRQYNLVCKYARVLNFIYAKVLSIIITSLITIKINVLG